MMKRRLGVVTLALLASGACAREEETPGIEGRFRLRGSTSDTVPFIAQRDPICAHWVVGGGAEFRLDGTYTSSFPMEHDCTNLEKIAIDTFGVKNGRYRMVSDTLILYNDEGKLTGYAHLNADTLLVRGPRQNLIYLRQK